MHETLLILKCLFRLLLCTSGEVCEEELSVNTPCVCVSPRYLYPRTSPPLTSTEWLHFLAEFFLPDGVVPK